MPGKKSAGKKATEIRAITAEVRIAHRADPNDPAEGRKYVKELEDKIALGDQQAMKDLAQIYSEGFSVAATPIVVTNLDKAYELYERLHKAGNKDALMNMAACRYNQKRQDEATRLYRQAAENDYVPAMFHYFYCKMQQIVAPSASAHASALVAVKSSSSASLSAPAKAINTHYQFKYDFNELLFACKMLRKALKQQPATVEAFFLEQAKGRAGNKLELICKGLGYMAEKALEKDELVIAFDLFTSIDTMIPRELNGLAEIKKNVKGRREEIWKGLWKIATRKESPDPKAQFEVAYCLEMGIGLEQDASKAKKFYQKAAKRGYQKAIEKLHCPEVVDFNVHAFTPFAPETTAATELNFEDYSKKCDEAVKLELLCNAAKESNLEWIESIANEMGTAINDVCTGSAASKVLLFMRNPTPKGKRPLHVACKAQQSAAAKRLIEVGSDIHVEDEEGYTPLKYLQDHAERITLTKLFYSYRTYNTDLARIMKEAIGAHLTNNTTILELIADGAEMAALPKRKTVNKIK